MGNIVYHSPAPGERHWEDFHEAPETPDLESGTGRGRRFSLSVPNPSSKEESDALQQRIAARLRKEVMTAGSTPTTSRRPSMSTAPDTLVEGDLASAATAALAGHRDGKKDGKVVDKVAFLRGAWRSFEDSQLSGIGRMLATGVPEEDELRLSRPGPSMAEQYHNPPPRINFNPRPQATSTATQATPELVKRPTKGTDSSSEDEKVPDSSASPSRPVDTVRTAEMICASAVMRSFAFLAGMGAVGGELATLCVSSSSRPLFSSSERHADSLSPQLRVHRSSTWHYAPQEGRPLPPVRVEALAQADQGRVAQDVGSGGARPAVGSRLRRAEEEHVDPHRRARAACTHARLDLRRQDVSRLLARTDLFGCAVPCAVTDPFIYLSRSAAAVSVYAVFLLAPSLQVRPLPPSLSVPFLADALLCLQQSYFVDYGLTSGIITIVVALAPTLGQSLLTFVIQVSRSVPPPLFPHPAPLLFAPRSSISASLTHIPPRASVRLQRAQSRSLFAILQILGTGFGSLLGLLILRIFLDVGGYKFNPYGIVCLLAVGASCSLPPFEKASRADLPVLRSLLPALGHHLHSAAVFRWRTPRAQWCRRPDRH